MGYVLVIYQMELIQTELPIVIIKFICSVVVAADGDRAAIASLLGATILLLFLLLHSFLSLKFLQ
jgi:hypothetical protein